MDTITRGNAAEAAVLYGLIRADVGVLVPFGDGECFDLAAVLPDERIVRVQVKSGRIRRGCVLFNACGSDHGRGRQHYRGRADLFAVHVDEVDRVFIVPVAECPSFVCTLRLAAARNNQRRGIRMADDYSIERWAAELVRPDTVDGEPMAAVGGRLTD